MTYFDYAAATPLDPRVFKAMKPYFSKRFHNPSALYLAARRARLDLEAARSRIAGHLGAKPGEVILTAGATEANNLAISGVMANHPDGEILISAVEHDSVLEPATRFKHRLIPVRADGVVDLAKFAKMLSPKTVMISVMYVNNELGTIQPLAEIRQILNKLSNSQRVIFHSDAAQAGNLFDLHTSRLGVDLLSLNGGKIYGPKQAGILYVKAGLELQPLILGGGQEFGLRSGTENPAAAAGLAEALDLSQAKAKSEAKRLRQLRDQFVTDTIKNIPGAIINGSAKHQSPHLVSLTLTGTDNERLVMELDEAGCQVAAGSACSASDEAPSHVLLAIGLSRSAAQSTLRVSFGRQTRPADIKKLTAELKRLTAVNR